MRHASPEFERASGREVYTMWAEEAGGQGGETRMTGDVAASSIFSRRRDTSRRVAPADSCSRLRRRPHVQVASTIRVVPPQPRPGLPASGASAIVAAELACYAAMSRRPLARGQERAARGRTRPAGRRRRRAPRGSTWRLEGEARHGQRSMARGRGIHTLAGREPPSQCGSEYSSQQRACPNPSREPPVSTSSAEQVPGVGQLVADFAVRKGKAFAIHPEADGACHSP